ncbi:DEAD/DEAH box helicase [Flavihumibacter fluvii]|uniref:DEAD/DEAH box helicase n=1 Tax=Flavihumibacter fluvii TaxID=2838157 RepID=UPI001BDECCC4|nr:DEAD/DEAH box helicase [Flavihumibacter fluvii]ULQ52367.1 DEAD/DEAH box helicase [Flavihumibacter fluvii]
MKFSELSLDPGLMEGIEATGYVTLTPIQEQVMPTILAGRDIIASAQTGTGKTAAFLLPVLSKLIEHRHEGHTSGIIIVPTRELAVQIAQAVEGMAYFTPISSIAIYGGGDGNAFVQEKQALQKGVDLVICTPGKLIAHLNMGYVKFDELQYLVLDEADRMLDMGFHDDIMRIIRQLPAKRQSLLFSATMPEKIRSLAKKILKDPAEVNIALSKPPEKIDQKAYVVYEPQKDPLIQHIIRNTPHRSLIIFCSRKHTVKQLAAFLKRNKFNVAEIHSDLEQSEREDLLQGFKSGRIPVIVATDVLSRGIDIDTIDVVVNYDVPHDGEDYVHRIGRTARAEKEGKAFTLVSDKEIGRFARIESLIGKVVEKAPVPAELGPAPEYAVHRRSGGSRGGGGNGPRPRPGNDGPRHSGGQPRNQENGHRKEGPRRETPPRHTPKPRTGPPKTIEKRSAPERAGENPAGPVLPATGDLN